MFIPAEFSLGPCVSNFILVSIDTYNKVKNYMHCIFLCIFVICGDYYAVGALCNIEGKEKQ